MVEPPRSFLPLALRSIASSIAAASKPLWLQYLPSSAAMTARTMVRSMRERPVQSLVRSEEHTSELQSLMRISYAVFCLKKNKQTEDSKDNHIKQKTTTN